MTAPGPDWFFHNGTETRMLRPCALIERGDAAALIIPSGWTIARGIEATRLFHKTDPALIWPHRNSRHTANLPQLAPHLMPQKPAPKKNRTDHG